MAGCGCEQKQKKSTDGKTVHGAILDYVAKRYGDYTRKAASGFRQAFCRPGELTSAEADRRSSFR